MAQDNIDEILKPILKHVEENSDPELFADLIAVSGDLKEYRVTQDEDLLQRILTELERMKRSIKTGSSS